MRQKGPASATFQWIQPSRPRCRAHVAVARARGLVSLSLVYCLRTDHCISFSVGLGVRQVLCCHFHLRFALFSRAKKNNSPIWNLRYWEARGRSLLPHLRNARLSANAVVRFVPPRNTHRGGALSLVLCRQIRCTRLSGGVARRAMWNEAKGTCIRSWVTS